MNDPAVKVLNNFLITALLATAFIGIGFYFLYGIEIAIIAIFALY